MFRRLLYVLITLLLTLAVSAQEQQFEEADAAVVVNIPLLHQDPDIVALTDKSLEHETQASTGQTTGSWILLWFHSDSNDDFSIEGDKPDASFWSEHHIVLAAVDAHQAPESTTRFGITKLPAIIFLHRGKLYRYDKHENLDWGGITDFVMASTNGQMAGEPVPPEATVLSKLQKHLDDLGIPLYALFGIQVTLFLAAMYITTFFLRRGKRNKEKSK